MIEISFILIIVFAIMSIIIFHRWRNGVYFLFIWLYIEDVIRKLIPGQPPQVMLIKDRKSVV